MSSRTMVSIVSQQNIPNYIFIKEYMRQGDNLLFITSEKFRNSIQYIESTLQISDNTETIILQDENDWNLITTQVNEHLSQDREYIVNLTGGTKFMVLALKEVFSNYQSSFYYIPLPQNNVLALGTSELRPITYRMGIEEFIHLSGLTILKTPKCATQSENTTNGMLTLFPEFSDEEKEIIDKLRSYRDKNIDIAKVEQKEDEENKPQIGGLRNYLDRLNKKVDFVWDKGDGKLHHEEIQYLTGGWFEEYIYHFVEQNLSPTDIKLGILLLRKGENTANNRNDLDVVFTKGNKLFVIECKTGIHEDKGSAFREIVYKATALKESLLGLSAESYIFVLSTAKSEQFANLAQYMRIQYCDEQTILQPDRKEEFINKINKTAN